jgi:hypothetical protein
LAWGARFVLSSTRQKGKLDNENIPDRSANGFKPDEEEQVVVSNLPWGQITALFV